MVNMSEAIVKIKAVGANNVRVVPMPNQNVQTGMHKIEVNEGGSWSTIVESIPRETAVSIVTQATNRVICG